MKKILITGGAGFIGYHLAKRLASEGHKIIIADDLFKGRHDDHLKELMDTKDVKLERLDLTDPKSWTKLGSGYDYVYHLAGINGTKLFYEIPHEVLRIGLLTTLNALDWFQKKNNKKDAKILYTSSNEAYASALDAFGQLPIPTPEEVPLVIADPYNPRWSYAGQKLIGELLFIHYAKVHNFRMAIVRPHNFYGPRAGTHHVIPEIITRIQNRIDPFPIYGSEDTRSFCYIDDAVEAIQSVMESRNTDGGTYHIGTNVETNITDLIKKMFTLMKWRPNKLDLHKSPKGSVKRRLPHVLKIKQHTGWKAKTSLVKGLRETIEWYLNHPYN